MDRFYEEDVKKLILEKEHVFGDLGDSRILFEKAIAVGSTITDCLILSEKKNFVGVEIKTERDSTKRLNKQLNNYSRVCDYVYVMCHDNHLDKVLDILKNFGHGHVGVISYTQFKGEGIVGVYKQPSKSPYRNAYDVLNILWKDELVAIMGNFRRQFKTLEEFGLNVYTAESRGAVRGLYEASGVSRKMRKPDIIHTIINRIGEEAAVELVCNLIRLGKHHQEKILKYHYFKRRD